MESTNVFYDDFFRAFCIFVVVIGLVAALGMLLSCSIVRKHSNSMELSAGFVHYVPSDASVFTSEYQTRFSSATTGVGVNIEVDGEFLE
ncbi:hypothetical protein T01_11747 [Trichinella spiralis]|uniref:Transmembrane protein n=1 Tax=Trichinella spiralis TaxID=6334 RepID=A0A0V1ARS4_TRISP|nr:hypothetical protein T01_11747 [Trichinella spiralis]